ncbi:hypothetical protein ACMAUO_20130 [Gluconacetobacter sp. Hr-1-5]|uniref:hypothetical protein n=1 Tax=Gluconacetobacter sp. Hr-1-5 TaxID=3395370 RepID=UPI003B51CC93
MKQRLKRLLRAVLPPRQVPKHREDRLKALAGAFQTVALAIVGIGLISPEFAATGPLPVWKALAAAAVAAVAEMVSLALLAYIPYDPPKED